jgi:peptide/nickel transport system substrate-binding protein
VSQSLVVDGSSVTVASAAAFTSFNDQTSFGNTAANRAIVGATNAGFAYYDDEAKLVRDESFGRFEVVSQSPFTVKYTIADGVTWSDGEPVDGADLLLAWAANSGHVNTEGFNPGRFVDDETGQFTAFPEETVYFDGASHSGLQFVSKVPQLGADGRSITLEYDEFFVDWELAFDVGVPAHVVGEQALHLTRDKDTDESLASASKRAVIAAIEDGDVDSLAPLAAAWNSAFTVGTASPKLFVGSGPYSVSKVVPDESVTLTANPLYTGERKPRFETVVVRTIADPLEAAKALDAGEVDVISPAPTVDVVDALDAASAVEVQVGASGMFEHLDLQFSHGKNATFDDPLLREAFLDVVPREQILTELITPLAPTATVRSSFVLAPWGESSTSAPAIDVAGARRLIAKSGVSAPAVCILFDPANPRRLAEFDLIAESAERAGFVVDDCSTSDWEGFLGVPGAYDAALFAWSESTAAVSAADARLRSTSSVSNYSHYSSSTVDGLLDELSVESDAAAQKALLQRIDAELEADSYGAPLYQFPSIVAHSSRVEGVTGSPFSGVMWNVWQWRPVVKGE